MILLLRILLTILYLLAVNDVHFLFEILIFFILIFFVFLIISKIWEYFHYIPNLLYSDRININNSCTLFRERPTQQELKRFVVRKFTTAKSYFHSIPGLCPKSSLACEFHPICEDIFQAYVERFPIGRNEKEFAQYLFHNRGISTHEFSDWVMEINSRRRVCEEIFMYHKSLF